jgi:hypothetical protein
MPVGEDAYREPYFIRYQERYPMSYDKKDKFLTTVNPRMNMIRHGGDRDFGWKQAGYNPNHQSTRVERISMNTEGISLKPY